MGVRRNLIAVLGLLLSACAHTETAQWKSPYFEAAFDDRNRAPASFLPPPNAADTDKRIDPVSVRVKADYNFTMGEAFSFEGQHMRAIESFRTTLLYDPDSSHVHLRLAAEYVKVGMMSEALESAEMAAKLNPKSIDARLIIAGIHSTLKAYDKALAEYQRILEIDPKNTEAPMYMGAVHAENKEYDKAIKYFEMLAKNEDFATPYLAWYYIGRIHADQETQARNKAAEKAFKKAVSLKPDHADSVISLGQIYHKMGQSELAIDVYRQFQRERGPNDRIAEVLAQYYLENDKPELALEQFEILEKSSEDVLGIKVRIALIQIELKRFKLAAAKLTEVLRQVPESDKMRFYLAAVHEEMGEADVAIEHFRKVPAASSFFAESVVHAAHLLKGQKKIDEALSVVEGALKERSDVPQFYSLAGMLLDEKGDLGKAEAYLQQGLKRFPESVQLAFFYGNILDRKGQKSEVIKQMRKVLEMDPNHVQGLNYLAYTFADMKSNLDEAEELVKRALAIEPKDGFILDTYGWILFQKGELRESAKVLEAAHAKQPNESIIAEHLGDVYFHMQMFEKAKAMYERAREKTEDRKKTNEIQQKLVAVEAQHQAALDKNRIPASVKGKSSKAK